MLVIDEQAHVAQVLKVFFTRAGYEVDTASNAEDGLRQALDSDPDAIITDYEMQLANGDQLIKTLLSHEIYRPKLIVVVTSRTDAAIKEWADQQERIGFVEKPPSPRRLIRYVASRLINAA